MIASSRTTLASVLLATLVTACSGSTVSTSDEHASVEPATMTALIRQNTHNFVSGRLSDGNTAIEFSLRRDGEALLATITSADGREVLTSTLANNFEDTSILEGRLRIAGEIGANEPTLVGDVRAMEELRGRPEYPLATSLLETLRARGVDLALLGPAMSSSRGGINIESAGNMNSWYTLPPAEQMDFPTWSFWIATNIIIHNDSHVDVFVSFRCGGGYEGHWVNAGQWLPFDVRCAASRLFVRHEGWDPNSAISIKVS